jgi:hypothetical protein
MNTSRSNRAIFKNYRVAGNHRTAIASVTSNRGWRWVNTWWVRSVGLFVGTVVALVVLSMDRSTTAALAAAPLHQGLGAAALAQTAPTGTSATSLGSVETNYTRYCQGDSQIERPICGGVGDGEVAPSASRTDFVLEAEKAPLEPIVLYQYDKVVLARSGF